MEISPSLCEELSTVQEMDSSTKKCHTCVANGFKQLRMWMTPEKKNQLVEYCKARDITMSGLMLQLINERLASDPLDQAES